MSISEYKEATKKLNEFVAWSRKQRGVSETEWIIGLMEIAEIVGLGLVSLFKAYKRIQELKANSK